MGRKRTSFDSSYKIIEPSNCWIWLLSKTGSGYGIYCIGVPTKKVSAHRFAYERKYGEISRYLELDHLCRRRDCVNPDHLEPVSKLENIRRGKAAKITLEISEKIREDYKTGKYWQRELAEKYGISDSMVGAIINHKFWRHI